jgi:hypothetical protein
MSKDIFTNELIEMLNAYLDGELDVEQTSQVEKILSENTQARSLLSELKEVSRMVRTLPAMEAPEDFSRTLQFEMERDVLLGQADLQVESAGRNHLRFRRLVAAAAMIVLLGAVGTIIYSVLFDTSKPHTAEPEIRLAKPVSPETEPLMAKHDKPGTITANIDDGASDIPAPLLKPAESIVEIPQYNTLHLAVNAANNQFTLQNINESLIKADIDNVVRIPLDQNSRRLHLSCGQVVQSL